jgi:hypothetical protein
MKYFDRNYPDTRGGKMTRDELVKKLAGDNSPFVKLAKAEEKIRKAISQLEFDCVHAERKKVLCLECIIAKAIKTLGQGPCCMDRRKNEGV